MYGRTLYDGSEEELNGTARSSNSSDSKQESPSAIPDWKSSHAVCVAKSGENVGEERILVVFKSKS